jgi:hypothetical protein
MTAMIRRAKNHVIAMTAESTLRPKNKVPAFEPCAEQADKMSEVTNGIRSQ